MLFHSLRFLVFFPVVYAAYLAVQVPSFARVPAVVALLYAPLVWGNVGGRPSLNFQF